MRRVVITGAGVYSALGREVDTFWNNCLAGKSVVKPIPEQWHYYSDHNSTIWSPLDDVSRESEFVNRIESRQLDMATVMSIIAGAEALQSAGFTLEQVDKKYNRWKASDLNHQRTGVWIGTGVGGISSLASNFTHQVLSTQHTRLHGISEQPGASSELDGVLQNMRYPKRFNPFVVSMLMPNASAAGLSIKFNLQGPSQTSCAACASGTIAVGNAYRAIQSGLADVMLSGGSEFLYDEYGTVFHGFDVVGALTTSCEVPDKANRPFDQDRSGFLFSQGGACLLVMEEYEHAIKRGAPVLAEVTGYSQTSDAHSIMSIDPAGEQINRMINELLSGVDLEAGAIDYINAHGTGTELNDKTESSLYESLFPGRPIVNSTKSLLGHTIGASGAFESLVTALSIKNNVVHGSRNLENPISNLNFARTTTDVRVDTALSVSFAFGGHNAALLLSKINE
jgi:3-oxoacyl-[acyl-carrier-protein] synthase II